MPSTISDAMQSASERPLHIRRRADLSAKKHYYLGRTYWIVKDPVGLHYYRFQEEEFFVLQMLNDDASLDEIKEAFEEEFPPQKITHEELHQFLGMLHRSGLILSGVRGQAQQLVKRRNERKRQEWLAALTNILCFRFKGIDPERLLEWMHGYMSWVYSTPAILLCLTLMISALSLVLVEFNVFRSKLPEFHQFFTAHNAFWLAVCLACTKVVHEFGHGLSCKHYGGECHEMGFMLLVLTPAMYCNVSDSWMLPNKLHRMVIGWAGMYIEMVMASIATFIWWYSAPGLLNNLCLNIMFICSVSTLIFNGNPLLRYDGYYILADFLEIPNLRQKATQILSYKASEWFLGLEAPEDPFLPDRNQFAFAVFAIASAIYRWVVVMSILLFLNQVWKPYKLEIIGNTLGLLSIYGMFVYPLYRMGKFLYVPGRLDKLKKVNLYSTIAGLAVLIAAFLFLPVPYDVMCTLEIQPRDATPVYVDVGGIVDEICVKRGEHVVAGQVVARLHNVDLELEINKLQGMRSQYETQLANLRYQRMRDPKAAADIPQLLEQLATVQGTLNQKQVDLKRLVLKSGAAGIIMPPPETPRREDPEGRLPAWAGTPLDRDNVGAYLEQGVLFCQVGDPQNMQAVLLVDQQDLVFVREGQKVDIKLEQLPHDTLHGQITRVASTDLKVVPKRLSSHHQGDEPTKVDPETGQERPINTSYQALVPLDDQDGLLRIGLRGRGKVHVDWQPLAQRVWRFLTHTFSFRM